MSCSGACWHWGSQGSGLSVWVVECARCESKPSPTSMGLPVQCSAVDKSAPDPGPRRLAELRHAVLCCAALCKTAGMGMS